MTSDGSHKVEMTSTDELPRMTVYKWDESADAWAWLADITGPPGPPSVEVADQLVARLREFVDFNELDEYPSESLAR